jgi:8-oxo-dGTP pyrophosphatase MutT (NUDIX family)
MSSGNSTLIPSATLMMVRARPHFSVLMMRRTTAARFAGGAWVFPGGKVDAADRDPGWRDLVDAPDCEPDDLAHRIAALRETFEEAGMLLAHGAGGMLAGAVSQSFAAQRALVAEDAARFRTLIAAQELKLAVAGLTRFARWVQPELAPKRFDTRFYIVGAPDQPAASDNSETTDFGWHDPATVAEDPAVIFPTRQNLLLLARSPGPDAALEAARMRPAYTVNPQIERHPDGGFVLSLPEEAGYGAVRERLERGP